MSDDSTKVYNVSQVFAAFFGVTITKGRTATGMAAGGPFLEIEQDGPDFTVKKGLDGSVVVSETNEPITIVTVHLMQTSAQNAVFSAMRTKGRNGNNGSNIGTAAIKDLQGTSIFESERCWVEGPPKVVYGAEGEERAWRIVCVNANRIDGGN